MTGLGGHEVSMGLNLKAIRPSTSFWIALWVAVTIAEFVIIPNGREKTFVFAFGSFLYLMTIPLGLFSPKSILPRIDHPTRWQAALYCFAFAAYTAALAFASDVT
jgi:hypothetical protein